MEIFRGVVTAATVKISIAVLLLTLVSVARGQDARITWEPGARYENISTPFLRKFDGRDGGKFLAFSPDGGNISAVSYYGAIQVWEISTGKLIRRSEAHVPKRTPSAAFSPDGRYVLTGDDDHTLKLWELSGRPLGIWARGHSSEVYSVAFAPDGRSALSGGVDGKLILWDVETGKPARTFDKRYPGVVYAAAFSPDGRFAASGGMDKRVFLWDVSTGKALRAFEGHAKDVMAVAFSPDGKQVLSGSGDQTLRLWDVFTGKTLKTFEGHADWIQGVAFSPDGRFVASGAADGTARLWDVSSGKLLRSFEGLGRFPRSIAFSADGRLLAVADGGAPKLWRMPSSKRGLDLFSELASQAVKQALVDHLGEKPAPQAASLTQGKYESTSEFKERVAKAQADLDAPLAAYQQRVSAFPIEKKTEALRNAFYSVFGEPQVAGTHYDADGELFSTQVAPTGGLGEGFQLTLVLREAIPKKDAEDFDRGLSRAKPKIRFALDGGRLSLEEAGLEVNGKVYAAVSSEASFERRLAQVDLSAVDNAAPETPDARKISVQYSDNPEMSQKMKELERLKKKRADKEKLQALEREIARLQAGEEKVYHSDVDRPKGHFPERPDDLALVIGIGRYKQLPEAQFAERDALAVKAQLLALGVPERNLVYLTGDQATEAALESRIEEWLPKNATPRSRVYFYYSGHGAPDPMTQEAYLVPYDGQAEYLKSTALRLKTLFEGLGRLQAKEVLVAMDSCFSGAGGRSVLPKGARPLVSRVSKPVLGPNITLLAAAGEDQISGSMESEGHGLFTYYFLKSLQQAPARASRIYQELKIPVESSARRENRDQTPVFEGPDLTIP